jgi:FKBP-type peptidyl-prolyl cis-trans isomerase FklB
MFVLVGRSGWSLVLLALVGLTLSFVVSEVSAGTSADGLKFLEENSKRPDVVVLPSGLQYRVITKGAGSHHPAVNTPCQCHYAGTLIDGTQFDSSYSRGSPATFAPNQVIKGWTEALQLMVEGDKWELFIPSELGYGDGGSPPKIPGGSVLIFTIEILQLQGDSSKWVPAIVCDAVTGDQCSDKELDYLKTWKAASVADLTKELDRLSKLLGSSLKPALANWVRTRTNLLTQLRQHAGDQ